MGGVAQAQTTVTTPGLTAGNGVVANGASSIQDAGASGATSVLFPKGVTLGAGTGSCALTYSGGGCSTGPSSNEVDLWFGTYQSYQFLSGGQTTINGQGTNPPNLLLNRQDAALSAGTTVGVIPFKGNDSASLPVLQTWGQFQCDATTTTGGAADSGTCRFFVNSGGALTEALDIVGATTGTTASIVALTPLSIPSAGDGEVGHYQPLEAPKTNLLQYSWVNCQTGTGAGLWTCTSSFTATLNATNMPNSPDGSPDMILFNTGGTSGVAKQTINLTSLRNPLIFFCPDIA